MPRTDWEMIDQTITLHRGIIPGCLVATGNDADDLAYRLQSFGCRLVQHNGKDISGLPDDGYWFSRARTELAKNRIRLTIADDLSPPPFTPEQSEIIDRFIGSKDGDLTHAGKMIAAALGATERGSRDGV